jgi:chromosome segregation ATPase
MQLKHFPGALLLAAGVAALPVVSLAADSRTCVAGKPTPASYTWNFRAEASQLLNDIQTDAAHAQQHADRLQTYASELQISYQSHGEELDAIRAEVNDMGRKLCRLEVIRRVVAPWQQAAIDRAHKLIQLMADNTQDAILFADRRQEDFCMSPYPKYAANLYRESKELAHSLRTYEEYAQVHREDSQLEKTLGMGTGY